MRIAVLSDIHGNWPALESVLGEVAREEVDLIVIAGDVLPGPMPVETLRTLRALPRARLVMGNGDRETVAAFDGRRAQPTGSPLGEAAAWAADRLGRQDRDFLAGFEPTVSVEVDGIGPTLFCHGSPRSDEEMITSFTPAERLRPMLKGVAERLVVCGHTHRQFEHRVDAHRILNAGSVGMPYEGRAGAYWLLLGPDVAFRRSEYDIASAAERMRAAGPPDVDELFLRESVLDPADPDEVQRMFERQAEAAANRLATR
jgi:predicted phosphodiesterase